jgi:DNA-binding response OmpR family regulator
MAKILIIDDDPDIVLAVRLCLQQAGHEVFDARNGDEGLRRVTEIKPDLIILDVMMDTTTGLSGVAPAAQSGPQLAVRSLPSCSDLDVDGAAQHDRSALRAG